MHVTNLDVDAEYVPMCECIYTKESESFYRLDGDSEL